MGALENVAQPPPALAFLSVNKEKQGNLAPRILGGIRSYIKALGPLPGMEEVFANGNYLAGSSSPSSYLQECPAENWAHRRCSTKDQKAFRRGVLLAFLKDLLWTFSGRKTRSLQLYGHSPGLAGAL